MDWLPSSQKSKRTYFRIEAQVNLQWTYIHRTVNKKGKIRPFYVVVEIEY